MQKTISKTIILLAVLTLALSVNYLFAAWTRPTQTPPAGNTAQPIHVGTTDQVKNGGLSVDALSVFGGGYFQGSVQVGSSGTSPQEGTVRFTGADFEGYMGGAWVSLTGAGLACTSFTYSGWGECQSNSTQTRTVTSSSPEGCVGGNPVTTQSCSYAQTQCASQGGSWNSSQQLCYFSTSSCPSGWSPSSNYSSTANNSCGVVGSVTNCGWQQSDPTGPSGCNTGSHTQANKAVETCSYCWGYQYNTCTASLTATGCFKL